MAVRLGLGGLGNCLRVGYLAGYLAEYFGVFCGSFTSVFCRVFSLVISRVFKLEDQIEWEVYSLEMTYVKVRRKVWVFNLEVQQAYRRVTYCKKR